MAQTTTKGGKVMVRERQVGCMDEGEKGEIPIEHPLDVGADRSLMAHPPLFPVEVS